MSTSKQRAYYRRRLSEWEAGTFSPPPGWAQMVANRFPDLVEQVRERVLGKQAAEAARAEHIRRQTPKVGEQYTAPSGLEVIVTGVDPVLRTLRVAPATRWNRFIVRLRLAILWVAGGFTRKARTT